MKTATRSILFVVPSLLLFVLCGCGVSSNHDISASDKTTNGNLVAFLDGQIAQNGGRLGPPGNTNAPFNCSWRFRSDSNGVQIFTDAKFFPEVDQVFRTSLGAPDIATEKTPGQFFVGYNIRRAGVAIQYRIAPSPFRDVPDPMLHIIFLKQQNLF